MNKKSPVSRIYKPKPRTRSRLPSWHNGGEIEIGFYARSLHNAAKTLIASLDLRPNTKGAWDACPVILLYRQSVELHLKALVDQGGEFLKERTDSISLAKTHSLRWLAQIVGQIIRAVKWENEFKCEGVSSLADFSALVDELEALDPVAVAVRPDNRRPDGWVPIQLLPPNVVQFAKRLDGLLDLLDATADGLAATKDIMEDETGPGITPTVQ
jgi:hypothetical protein